MYTHLDQLCGLVNLIVKFIIENLLSAESIVYMYVYVSEWVGKSIKEETLFNCKNLSRRVVRVISRV